MARERDENATTTGSLEAGQLALRVCQVRVVHAPVMPKRGVAILESQPLVVGREPDEADNAIAIADREMSRRHAVLEREDGAWIVRDLGSRNGMYVDGEQRDSAPLQHGSIVRIGKSVLLYQEIDVSMSERLDAETPGLLGPSVAMQRVRAEIALVAKSAVPVLVLGETGVGKERVAEEIHRQSGRTGPLVPINCASIPGELAESELFGHAAGAFTGAAKRSVGLFLAAHQGTLFLDEIGEMPPLVQAKVLRALESGEVRPVGSQEAVRVDVRIVAATHRDLAADAATVGSFRGDLLARLQGWTIRVPPLRERRDDVIPLARPWIEAAGCKLSADAAEALVAYGFPFNVRELRQLTSVAVVRAGASGGEVRLEHLPPGLGATVRGRARAARASSAEAQATDRPIEASVPRDVTPSKLDFLRVLEAASGNVARVAEFFRKDRQQIYRWAKRFDVDLEAYRDGKG